ncbi:Transcription factor TFIIIB component B [Mycoblastus sanguinarius]|nr:Transcription factor TFIIIB component B [Mycoblastus sanguinarius]
MSALGSSVISMLLVLRLLLLPANLEVDKSGKKFGPKKPVARRPAAPTSTQNSARPSVDRQLQSQNPQSAAIQCPAPPSPSPSVSLPTPASTQQPVTDVPPTTLQYHEASQIVGAIPIPISLRDSVGSKEVTPQCEGAIPVATPSRNNAGLRHASPRLTVPQKRTLELGEASRQTTPIKELPKNPHASGRVVPIAEPNKSFHKSNAALTTTRSPSITREVIATAASPDLPTAATQSLQAANDGIHAPAAKRLRLGSAQVENSALRSCASDTNLNVPIPTTETNEPVAGPSRNAQAPSARAKPTTAKKAQSFTQAKRKQRAEAAADEIVADATRSLSATKSKPRKNAKGKGVQRAGDAATESTTNPAQETPDQAEQNAAPTKAKRKYTRKKADQRVEDTAARIVGDAVQGSSKDPKERGRKCKRAATPEGADTMLIVPSTVKMAELCREIHTGRKSKREGELQQLEQAEVVRQKQRQVREIMGETEPGPQAGPSEPVRGRRQWVAPQREREESVAHQVPNTIIVNGQIQIEEESLHIDRHKVAAVERAAEQLESVDETDLSRKINSATWLRRDRSGGWNELLTERFYDGLRMFGTDFEMISKMFPGRTRHKVKLKFVKEEKENAERIKSTLLGERLAVDMPEFEKMAGTEFDDPNELEKDLEEDRKRLEEETAAEKQAMDDAVRERQEAAAAERAAAGEESSSKENSTTKGRKKGTKRNKSASRRNEKQAKRANAAGDVVGDLGEMLGIEN